MVSGLMLVGGAAAQAKASPRQDYPRMPRSCVDPQDLIPQQPGMCKLTTYRQGRPTVVLWGDSHAWQLIPAMKGAIKGRNVNLVAFLMGGCPPMDPNLKTATQRKNASSCEKSNDLALRYALNRKRAGLKTKLVLAGAWDRYLTPLRQGTPPTESYAAEIAQDLETDTPRLFRRLGAARVSADVVGQSLEVPKGARCPEGRNPFVCSLPRSKALHSEGANKRWVKNAMRPLVGKGRYLTTNGAVCTVTVCRGKLDDIYTFFDDLHLSASRSRTLARYFKASVADAVR
ncbi:MAG: SGNH hydrolase domain-containing protein [Nocardioides sp.]|nr:SGNH hydrolase domain-containing protein [Nocardioides sp.]